MVLIDNCNKEGNVPFNMSEYYFAEDLLDNKKDSKKDNKKDNYIECCNELYIITNDYSVKLESEKNRNITGIIYYDTLRNSINVYKNDITNNNVKLNKDEVVKKIYNKYWNKIHKI